jgi:hypothetical protein
LTHGGGTDEGDALSPATREAAQHARRRAAQEVPTADYLAGMTIAAGRDDLSRAEIRRIAAEAIGNLQQINFLLGRLVELSGEEGGP